MNQKLEHHPHVHCVVPEGGLAADGSRWVRPRYDWFLPVKALAKMFRGKFLDALREAFNAGELRFRGQMRNLASPNAFAALLQTACRHRWVVYAKRTFGGPEHVLQYLGITRTGSRSPIIGFWRWRMAQSASAGATRRTRTNNG